MDLLLDCAMFSPLNENYGNYYQCSGKFIKVKSAHKCNIKLTYLGIPISEVKTETTLSNDSLEAARKLGSIAFVRSRMMYARPALNAKGGIRFGMRHIRMFRATVHMNFPVSSKLTVPDVLNRFPDHKNNQAVVHIMRYIFPRQFRLHNVFTSTVDGRETAMRFKDYTLREAEINRAMQRDLGKTSDSEEYAAKWKTQVPKRLRGEAVELTAKLCKLNRKCSYMELLRHYCPIQVIAPLNCCR